MSYERKVTLMNTTEFIVQAAKLNVDTPMLHSLLVWARLIPQLLNDPADPDDDATPEDVRLVMLECIKTMGAESFAQLIAATLQTVQTDIALSLQELRAAQYEHEQREQQQRQQPQDGLP